MKAKVQFDSAKIQCYNQTTSQSINPGDEVKEQDSLLFSAQLSGDTVVDEWILNDKKVQTGGTELHVMVGESTVKDEGGEKVIKVRCTFK